jgi:REP element-mobilizing transposase RayT
MVSDVERRRRSLRLKGYDYSRVGAYFMTLCTQNRLCLFGEIIDGEMRLSDVGRMVASQWSAQSDRFPVVELDAFVVMPNHIHGILWIESD